MKEITNTEPPEFDELEITTIGPGAKNGESIVLHLGNDEWWIIDSCKAFGEVLPLQYLKSIGISLDKVKKVICTHWHTDHIRGIDKVLAECPNAEFYCPFVGDAKSNMGRFLRIADIPATNSNIWKRFEKCLAILAERKKRVNFLTRDLYFYTNEDESVRVYVLGPSDEMIDKFEASLLNLNPEKPDVKCIEEIEANLCSIALSVRFYDKRLLLGGDMETGRSERYNIDTCSNESCAKHENCGWCDVKRISVPYRTTKKFDFTKLPHHSSSTAFCPQMWPSDFIDSMPIATTTRFNCNNAENLPTRQMLEIYHSMCSNLYITSDDKNAVKAVERDDIVDLDKTENVELLELPVEDVGWVTFRSKPEEQEWRFRKFGTAKIVDEEFLKSYHVG